MKSDGIPEIERINKRRRDHFILCWLHCKITPSLETKSCDHDKKEKRLVMTVAALENSELKMCGSKKIEQLKISDLLDMHVASNHTAIHIHF